MYIIEKGEQYSSVLPHLLLKKEIEYTIQVSFDSQFLNDEIESNYRPIHKLVGISDSFSHHINSIRVGWKINSDCFSLYSITYVNGVVNKKHIIDIPYEKNTGYKTEIFSVKINIKKNKYIIIIKHKDIFNIFNIERKSKWWGPRLLLKPYYGGTKVSPD